MNINMKLALGDLMSRVVAVNSVDGIYYVDLNIKGNTADIIVTVRDSRSNRIVWNINISLLYNEDDVHDLITEAEMKLLHYKSIVLKEE